MRNTKYNGWNIRWKEMTVKNFKKKPSVLAINLNILKWKIKSSVWQFLQLFQCNRKLFLGYYYSGRIKKRSNQAIMNHQYYIICRLYVRPNGQEELHDTCMPFTRSLHERRTTVLYWERALSLSGQKDRYLNWKQITNRYEKQFVSA